MAANAQWRKVINGIEVCTGATPATAEQIASRRISLANANRLAAYHAPGQHERNQC